MCRRVVNDQKHRSALRRASHHLSQRPKKVRATVLVSGLPREVSRVGFDRRLEDERVARIVLDSWMRGDHVPLEPMLPRPGVAPLRGRS